MHVAERNRLEELLDDLYGPARRVTPMVGLQALVAARLDRLPMPGHGATWQRWQVLARVAGADLGLAKLSEGHTDALAILSELETAIAPPGSTWGTWAADPPEARVTATATAAPSAAAPPAAAADPADPSQEASGLYPRCSVRLNGVKAWCSGAAGVSHGLLTVRDDAGALHLAAVALAADGITLDASTWQAVGMAASASIDIVFSNTKATVVGRAGAYLDRPGFWQGGAGVAACWYGAAASIGQRLRTDLARPADPHFLAHLGAIDVALASGRAVLEKAACRIDDADGTFDMAAALQVRLCIEGVADTVVRHAARAVGAAPLCRDAGFAQLMADLPVFIRQSHAERDLAALGAQVLTGEGVSWQL